MTEPGAATRCGFVAILGAPNVGKSTLINLAVGTKVSIVSPKVQTTRARVLGIAMEGSSQIIFVDTPGIFAPRRRLDRAMVAAAWTGAADADVVLLLVDAKNGLDPQTDYIINKLASEKRRAIVAINKIDLVKKPVLLDLAAALDKRGLFDRIFMISATSGEGVRDLLDFLAAAVPEGPWHYPEDQATDLPSRMLASEITREQLYLQLEQELPYATMVETEQWEESPDGSIRVHQVIYVERDGQKGIVLGKGGQRFKAIGAAARKELEALFERRIHLFLFVKVRPRWAEDSGLYGDWGLDFDAKG
jgi:GTP-binding protein Era